MKKSILGKSIIALLCLICFSVSYLQLGNGFTQYFADFLYQQGGFLSGNVYLIEIDAHSMEELGPYQTWPRDYVAYAIEALNQDSDIHPAVIGVDVLYIGESYEDADAHLVEACKEYGNVVLGSLMDFGTIIEEVGTNQYGLTDTVVQYEEPFEQLKAVTQQGFVNGFTDKDGVVRHGLLKKQLPDGREVESFSRTIVKAYEKTQGISFSEPRTNKNAYWYIPYQGKPGAYSNSFSLSDLIEGEIDPVIFADSIVLIGPYAEGMLDSYRTAIDHSETMYGLEIHANMIDAMLQEIAPQEVPVLPQAVALAVFACIACLICGMDKLRYGIYFAILSILGYPLMANAVYQRGYVLQVFYFPAVGCLIPIFYIVIHYIRVLQQKRIVEKTFKRYVDPQIVNKILDTGIDKISLGGESREIACLFVDIRGFTTMSEAMTPEDVVSVLNEYFEATCECIFRHHGTLDKFVGDAMMAVFNAPIDQTDYVYEAVAAAWDMISVSKELSEKLQEKFGRDIQFGVGVHCGPAVVGNIGTEKRMDYTAIGDTVNTAARLEANAPGGTVLISKRVLDRLTGRVKAESVGCIPLKGKQEELEIFRVIGING